jgi:hypothetical protein
MLPSLLALLLPSRQVDGGVQRLLSSGDLVLVAEADGAMNARVRARATRMRCRWGSRHHCYQISAHVTAAPRPPLTRT